MAAELPLRVPISDEDRRALGMWAADCAERALGLFEAKANGDARPRDAIEGIRAHARGELRVGRLRAIAMAAHAAARAVADPAAAAAARAAGAAAATPFIHPIATSNMAKHILAAAAYAAHARELAGSDGPAIAAAELEWAIDHAPPAVRALARRMPYGGTHAGRIGFLLHQLDAGLRGTER